jgi:repressor LexA
MPDPTDRQRAIFEFIRAFFTGNQRMPSLREIGDEFGFASVNGVVCHLKALAKKGQLTSGGAKARAIRLCVVRIVLVEEEAGKQTAA